MNLFQIVKLSVFVVFTGILSACSSGGDGIGNLEQKPKIVVQPISFDADKTTPFTTPSVFSYINDTETSAPFIVAWNDVITAQYGTVAYNGDGTFTYTPQSNIVSGPDSFSFKVANTNGSTAQGQVTLNIRKGWGIRTDFTSSVDYRVYQAEKIGNEYVAIYRDNLSSNLIRKMDRQNGTWLDPITLGDSITVVDNSAQHVKLFRTTTVGTETTIHYREYNPVDNSLSTEIPLEIITFANVRLYRGYVDAQGNVLLQLSRSYTDPVTNYYYVYYLAKYYDSAAGAWHETIDTFDTTSGTIQQNEPKLIGGKPVILVRFPGGAKPVVYEYDTNTRIWSQTPLSAETLATTTNSIGWFTSVQNSQGDVAIFWYQKVTDTLLAQDFWHLKVNIVSAANGSLLGEQTLEKIPATKGITISLNTLNDTDFLFMWRDYQSSVVGGDVKAEVYNTTSGTFSTAVTVVAGHVDGYLNPTPSPMISSNGNVVFRYWTKDSVGNYLHAYKVLPYGQNWSGEQVVNAAAITSGSMYGAFDANNDYYSVFVDGAIQVQKYDFSSTTKSVTVPVGIPGQIYLPTLVSSSSGRLFVSRLHQNVAGLYDLCLDEINVNTVLTSSSITNQGCGILSAQSTSSYQITLFEGSDQVLRMVANTREGTFSSEQILGNWTDIHFIYQPQGEAVAPGAYSYANFYMYPYGDGTEFSLLTNHTVNYYSGGTSITERKLFGTTYN